MEPQYFFELQATIGRLPRHQKEALLAALANELRPLHNAAYDKTGTPFRRLAGPGEIPRLPIY